MHSGYLYQTVPLFFFSSRYVKIFDFTPFAGYPSNHKIIKKMKKTDKKMKMNRDLTN